MKGSKQMIKDVIREIKQENAKWERLEMPGASQGKKRGKHMLKGAHVVEVSRMHRLLKNKNTGKMGPYDLPSEKSKPIGPKFRLGHKIKVAKITCNSHFYNPTFAISKAINDSLSPESEELRKFVRVSKFRHSIIRVLKETELAKQYRLPNGYDTWIPKSCILEEGIGYILVNRLIHIKSVWRLKSKFGGDSKALSKERASYLLLQKRNTKTSE